MEKVYKFNDCTVTVHIPETKKDIRKASERFMREVIKERGERNER